MTAVAPAHDEQCPTCGRVPVDWVNRAPGGKGRQTADRGDRQAAYNDWRWWKSGGYYVCDIDQLEWRIIDGAIRPVAYLELSRVDGNVSIEASSYKARALERMQRRDGQGAAAVAFASLLGVHAYFILWRWDLTEFWLYNLTQSRGWRLYIPARYVAWLKGLPYKTKEHNGN